MEGMSHVPGPQLRVNHGGNSQQQEGAASRARGTEGRQQAEGLGLYKCERSLFALPRATRAPYRVLKGARGWRRSSSGGAEPQWVSMTQRDRSGEKRPPPRQGLS